MRWISFVLAGCLLLGMAAPAPEEKRISIYSPAADYSLGVTQREGKDYVGLLEILEPLGSVTARMQGQKWQLRFNDIDAQFTPGNSKARIRGREVDLSARFLMENNRGLIPVDSLVTLLPNFLGIPVLFHTTARRLFISEAGTTYKTEFSKTTSKLVLNFSSPVNPTIGTEPGKLNMVFVRDPLLPSGPETVNFNDKAISSAAFKEINGAAEITVNGGVPLLASFSNDGRTITVAPAPAALPTPAPPQAAAAAPAATPAPTGASPAPSGPPPPAAAGTPRYFAVVDASHGGDERGAALSNQLVEKDVTLAFAQRIRQELESRGIPTLMLRDSDSTLTADQRASTANAARPAIYISIHAASDGTGVRVYTALLPYGGDSRGPFVVWDGAQMPVLPVSQAAASSVAAELRKKIPVRTLVAPLRPLNNVISAAIAIEIAPQSGDIADLSSPSYQQLVAAAVATGVVSVRDKLEASR